jgi:protein-tyrosine-phosphatase
LKRTFSILFVCTGNTCRSPLAETVMKAELAREGATNIMVSSAGTDVRTGDTTSRNALAAARVMGLRLQRRKARPLTRTRVARADIILAMTESQKGKTVVRWPEAEGKVFVIPEFSGSGREEIRDPMGGPERLYIDCVRALQAEIRKMMPRLRQILKQRGSRE